MMMRKLLASLMILGTAVGFSACKDDKKDPTPDNTRTMGSLYQSLKEKPQSFTVNAGSYQRIEGARGTVIQFNAQSFKDGAGNIISTGTVDIALTEAYTPGQMIMNNVTTVTDMNLALSSGGCVNIVATINNHEVFANNYSISFKQPAPNEQPMSLYKGIVTSDPTPGTVLWSNESTNPVSRATKDTLTSSNNIYYAFDTCLNFNWVNCDRFLNFPDPKTDVKLVVPDSSYNLTNTRFYIIFPGMNMVTGLSHYDAATHTANLEYLGYELPVGTNISVMIIGAKDGNYFMSLQQNITVTNNMSIPVTPVAKTLAEIQNILSGL